jgi:hypothetical protein
MSLTEVIIGGATGFVAVLGLEVGAAMLFGRAARLGRSKADQAAEDAEQMAQCALEHDWRKTSSAYMRAKDCGDDREVGRLLPAVVDIQHARLRVEMGQLTAVEARGSLAAK